MKAMDFTSLVGNTPIVQYATDEVVGAKIWVKLEGCNPTGSIKDRPCLYQIRGAEERGELQRGMTLLDASGGSMGCSLAYFGRMLGYKVTTVCNTRLAEDQIAFIRYFGATICMVGNHTMEGNSYCREVLWAENPEKYCFLDQLHNWDNPKSHFETTGPEIVRDFPRVGAVVGSLGSGGTMNGVGRFIKESVSEADIIGVEAASGTRLPGTWAFDDGDYATPFIKQIVEEKIVDRRIKVSAVDAMRRTRELTAQGFFCGRQTGGVIHAAIFAINEYGIEGDVVVISGDAGWKYMTVLTSSQE